MLSKWRAFALPGDSTAIPCLVSNGVLVRDCIMQKELQRPPEAPKVMAQYSKIENSIGSIGSIVLAILEVQVHTRIEVCRPPWLHPTVTRGLGHPGLTSEPLLRVKLRSPHNMKTVQNPKKDKV